MALNAIIGLIGAGVGAYSAYKQNQQELLNNSRNTLCGQGNMDLIS